MDGRALIDAGSERREREREMKLGFYFILGGAVIGLERPGGYVCEREEEREGDIYIRDGRRAFSGLIHCTCEETRSISESITTERIRDLTRYIPIIYIYPPIYPSINCQQQLLLLNQPHHQQQRSKSPQVIMKASLSTLLFLATAAGLAQAAAATENLVARGK